MLVAYAAGLRISETVALQIPDIKPDKQLLHIRSAKGGTERMVPLPPDRLFAPDKRRRRGRHSPSVV